MAIMLPPELSKFLNMVGFEWPEGNEDTVRDWAGKWNSYGEQVAAAHTGAAHGRDGVLAANKGPAAEAFQKMFNDEGGVDHVARNLATAATVAGGCLLVISMAIIALKVLFVINLVQFMITFVEAVAAAIPTAGASMTLVPIAELIAQRAIQFGINLAVEKVMGG